MSDKNNPKEYGAQSIQVIEGLEAVRKRPAMYIGSTGAQGLHHLVYEIVDNSVDEALAGHATSVQVTLQNDGSCSVEDNGRGIPTGIHPTEGVSAAEVALTKLHAGGKFDKESYKFSGGLHGVGISVVNALSKELSIEIFQNGEIHAQSYKKGKPQDKLHVIGKTTKRGTLVRFLPDPEIFKETVDLSFDILSARMRELAFLNKGLRITIRDERSNKGHEFYFEGGIVSFVQHVNSKKEPLFPEVIYAEKEEDTYVLEIALQYNDSYGEQLFSFVNNINTIEGGTHVSGFKGALTKACNKRAQALHVLKEQESFSSDDVREGLVAVISIKIAEPQFEGQTKTKLGNSEIKGIVESWAFNVLDTYFEEHPAITKKILQKASVAMQARDAARKAREITRRKSVLESTVLPGKLADCSSEVPADSEIFIVEGDSAGGSAKSARDRHTQAILPLRGKILNVEKARFDKILSNEEIRSLMAAVGAGIGDDFTVDKARYHKIILMTDADVDGSHIRTLLLTFFYRYMKPIIEKGYLYIAKPPLYKAKIGKREQYLEDDHAFKKFLTDWLEDQGYLVTETGTVAEQEWRSILHAVLKYQDLIETIAAKYKITYYHCYQLISACMQLNLLEEKDLHTIFEALKKFFSDYTVSLHEESTNPDEPLTSYIHFNQLNHDWKLTTDFFLAAELPTLLTLSGQLKALSSEWTLKLVDRDKQATGSSILAFMSAMSRLSKSYIQIQRYKGLGEMNPEQLWETAMDPKVRTLIQVSLGDAVEADAWFDTLMGSDVTGRKEFIEQNGHFVKNLDI